MMRKLLNEELDRLSVEEFKITPKNKIVVVLDNIRSMNNIGSVFRTSDAFLIEKIYLCGITACPPQNEIHKTALGATDTVNWQYCEQTTDIIDQLHSDGYRVWAIEQAQDSIALDQLHVEEDTKIAVVFGHEVRGVQQKVVDVCDGCIEIPQFGTKHSLNISVCAGIVLWELAKPHFK